MRTTRLLVLVVLVAAASGALGFFGRPLMPTASTSSGATASPDSATPEVSAVTALGRLEPASEVVAVSAPAGSRIDRVVVHETDFIAKGAPLAYLDSHAEMTAARNLAKIQWEEARKRYQAETTYGQAAIEAARLHLRSADEVALLGIKAQEAEVRRAGATLDKARLDAKRARQMLKDTAIPQSQYDGTALVVREAEEQVARNQATLAQLQEDRQIKMRILQAELESAEAALTRAQVAAQIDSLAEGLKLAEAKLERTVIRAPLAGQVLKILTRAGESVGADPILKMGDTKNMEAVAEVYETDVRRVRPGQRAIVTSRAFPDRKLTGHVERISALVHRNDVLKLDPTADADARVLEVRIRLDESALAAQYNYLQVDVRILVGAP